jgi:hypothetical protein
MKTTGWMAMVLFLALLSVDLLGQDEPEIILIQHIEDKPLAEVVNQLALVGGLKVEVEPALREKKITLDLDDSLEAALEKVAKAAGGHLIRKGPKAFAIRSQPAVEGETEAPPKVPEWVRPLAKKLEETEVTFTWAGEPLPKILAWLSKESGVRIHLDPRVLKEKSKEDLAVHIAQYDASLSPLPTTASADRALGMALAYPTLCLARTWRFGGVWVSTREHIEALPPAPAAPEGDPELKAKIEAARVTVKISKATLQKALEKVGKQAGVKIVLDRKLRSVFKKDRVDLDVADQALLEVLDLILGPRGLVLEAGETGLVVVRPVPGTD